MTTTKLRYPVIGETWTFQSCLKHGCPSPYPYDYKKFPVALHEVIDEIKEYMKELVECGCMEAGQVNPRLHEPQAS